MPRKVGLSKSDEALIPDDLAGSYPGRALERVHAALAGEIAAEMLEPDEVAIFWDLFAEREMQGNTPSRAAKMYAEGGYVGDAMLEMMIRAYLSTRFQEVVWKSSRIRQDLISTEGVGPLQGLKPTLCTSRSPRPLPWSH